MKKQKNHLFLNGSKISLHQIVRKQMNNSLMMMKKLLIWSSYKGKVIMFCVGQQELKNKYLMKNY